LSAHRLVDSVLVGVGADEVQLDATVEHPFVLCLEGAVAFVEQPRVREEILLRATERILSKLGLSAFA